MAHEIVTSQVGATLTFMYPHTLITRTSTRARMRTHKHARACMHDRTYFQLTLSSSYALSLLQAEIERLLKSDDEKQKKLRRLLLHSTHTAATINARPSPSRPSASSSTASSYYNSSSPNSPSSSSGNNSSSESGHIGEYWRDSRGREGMSAGGSRRAGKPRCVRGLVTDLVCNFVAGWRHVRVCKYRRLYMMT